MKPAGPWKQSFVEKEILIEMMDLLKRTQLNNYKGNWINMKNVGNRQALLEFFTHNWEAIPTIHISFTKSSSVALKQLKDLQKRQRINCPLLLKMLIYPLKVLTLFINVHLNN